MHTTRPIISRLCTAFALIGAVAIAAPVSAQVRYVDDDASSNGTGQSWGSAYRYLQDALGEAESDMGIVEIRVAGGVYTPDQDEGGRVAPGDRSTLFQMRTGLAIRGGCRGLAGGGDADDRDIQTFESVLSGDLAGNDETAGDGENSHHVVSGSGVDAGAVLDGFTITAGNANNGSPDDSGGGMVNGGGIPQVVHCTFVGNSATNGGAMVNAGCNPTVVNCAFLRNTASQGGAVFNGTSVCAKLTNCVFVGNSATFEGGAVYNEFMADPIVTNCTIVRNSSNGYAGGVYNFQTVATVNNCILWGNEAAAGMVEWAQIFDDGMFSTVRYSCIQDDIPGDGSVPYGLADGNIDGDPVFVRAPDPGPDGQWDGVDDDFGDLYLQDPSPCIDAADNTSVPADEVDVNTNGDVTERTPLDIARNPRFMDHPTTDDTGVADPPDYPAVVDMGAYEHQVILDPADFDADGDVDLDDYDMFTGCMKGPLVIRPGDYDYDGDVDLDDYTGLRMCLAGPGVVPGGGCAGADLDGDTDLDLADFAILQAWFTGSDPAMTPECGPVDLDLDQDVDAADYAAFVEHFTG